MELLYKQSMEEYGLSYDELPEDAKTGIDQIDQVLKSKKMLEKVGKSLTARALRKIKANDKWVHYEIIDYVNETENNKAPLPNLDEVEEEIEDKLKNSNESEEDINNEDDQNIQDEATTRKGLQIESELERMYINGQFVSAIEDIKSLAPVTYNHLFDTYVDGEENGIVTSKFSLIERNKKFELKQK